MQGFRRLRDIKYINGLLATGKNYFFTAKKLRLCRFSDANLTTVLAANLIYRRVLEMKTTQASSSFHQLAQADPERMGETILARHWWNPQHQNRTYGTYTQFLANWAFLAINEALTTRMIRCLIRLRSVMCCTGSDPRSQETSAWQGIKSLMLRIRTGKRHFV